MTAETLKPFITPTSDSFPTTHSAMSTPSPTASRRQLAARSSSLPLVISIFACLAAAMLLAFAVWHTLQIRRLDGDLANLNKIVESMKDRLGLEHLDEFNEFEKEYNKAFIDNGDFDQDKDDYELHTDQDGDEAGAGSGSGKKPSKHHNDDDDEDAGNPLNINGNDDDDDEDNVQNNDDDDDEDGSDDDDEDEEDADAAAAEDYADGLEEWIKKYNNYDDNEESGSDYDEDAHNASDDDNLYDDFEKFKDAKNKKREQGPRKSRSIEGVPSEMALLESTPTSTVQPLTLHNNTKIALNHGEPSKAEIAATAAPLTATKARTTTPRAPTQRRRAKQASSGTFMASHRIEELHQSPLRQRTSRRRQKLPLVKSGDSLISAKMVTRSNLMEATQRPAAHFHLNRKIPDSHTDYKVDSFSGDMYIGHPSWTNELPIDPYFSVDQGVLTVREPGLYYVYAQVCYNNMHDQNGFVIFHGQRPFLQCLNTVPTNMQKMHTCHTGGLVYLQADESIHLRDFHTDRDVFLRDANNRSYFGLIKM